MNILIIDSMGLMLGLAMKLPARHECRMYLADKKEAWPNSGKGFVDFVPDYKPHVSWADLILIADVGYGKLADSLRKKGKYVVGGTEATDRWELDRKLGQSILKACGIDVLPAKEFSTIKSALPFVESEARKGIAYVSKPNDDKNDKSLSFVPKEPADLIDMMHRWEKLGKIKSPFLLQRKVKGVEMAVGGWWTDRGWADEVCCENFEHKKFLSGDLGPNTGESGTVLKYVPIDKSRLGTEILRPLEKALGKTDYVGYVDVNCIVVDGKKGWPLEFTMRPGYPTLYIQGGLHRVDYGTFFRGLVEYESDLFNLSDCAVGVVLAIPDYPYSRYTSKEVEGYPVSWTEKKGIYWVPQDIMKEGNRMVTAGDYIGVATGIGPKIRENREAANAFLKDSINMAPSRIFRDDIGEKLVRQIPELGSFGTNWKGAI